MPNWLLLSKIFNVVLSIRYEQGTKSNRSSNDIKAVKEFDFIGVEANEELKVIVRDLKDSECRAILADYLWLRKEGVEYAHIAIREYFKHARAAGGVSTVSGIQCYERSLRLALQIDQNGKLPQTIYKWVERSFFSIDPSKLSRFELHVPKLLIEFDLGNSPRQITTLLIWAETYLSIRMFDEYRECLGWIEKISRKLGNVDTENESRLKRIISYSEQACIHENKGEYFLAHHWLQEALPRYEEQSSLKDQVPSIKRRLLFAAKERVKEMNHTKILISSENLKHEQKKTRQIFKDLDFVKGIIFLADDLVCDTDKQVSLEGNDVLYYLQHAKITSEGLTIANVSRHANSSLEKSSIHQKVATVDRLSIHRSFVAFTKIWPAIEELRKIKTPDSLDIQNLLKNVYPLGSSDRLQIVSSGIDYGFKCDFLTALHLLIPQAEWFLRELLKDKDADVLSVTATGSEKYKSLEALLLNSNQLSQIVGRDFIDDFQLTFTDSIGPNIRNGLAHGFLPTSFFESLDAVYAWWLLLKLFLTVSFEGNPTHDKS